MNIDSTPPTPASDFWIDLDESDSAATIGWATTPDVASGIASWKMRWRLSGGSWSSWTQTTDDRISIPGATIGQSYEVNVITIDAVRNESATAQTTLTLADPSVLYGTLGLPDVEPDDYGYEVTTTSPSSGNTTTTVASAGTLNPNKDCRLHKAFPGHEFGARTTKTPVVTWGWHLTPTAYSALLGLSPSWDVRWTGQTWINGAPLGQPAPHPPPADPSSSLWLAYTYHSRIWKIPNTSVRLKWGDVIHLKTDMEAISVSPARRAHVWIDFWCTVKR